MGGIWHTHQQTIASMQPDSANHVHAKSMGLLSDLSNGDKHKRLHLVGARVSTARTTRTDKGTVTGEPVITVSYEPLEDGDELQRVDMSGLSFGPESHTGFAAEFAFDVAFGKGGPAAGRPVIDTLTGIQSAVDSVLEYFAPWFDPSHDKWAMP
jgi:hypothetical protein